MDGGWSFLLLTVLLAVLPKAKVAPGSEKRGRSIDRLERNWCPDQNLMDSGSMPETLLFVYTPREL